MRLILALRGGGGVFVRTPDGALYPVGSEGTIEDLKWKMAQKLGVAISRISLIAEGRTLNDGELNEFVSYNTMAEHQR